MHFTQQTGGRQTGVKYKAAITVTSSGLITQLDRIQLPTSKTLLLPIIITFCCLPVPTVPSDAAATGQLQIYKKVQNNYNFCYH